MQMYTGRQDGPIWLDAHGRHHWSLVSSRWSSEICCVTSITPFELIESSQQNKSPLSRCQIHPGGCLSSWGLVGSASSWMVDKRGRQDGSSSSSLKQIINWTMIRKSYSYKLYLSRPFGLHPVKLNHHHFADYRCHCNFSILVPCQHLELKDNCVKFIKHIRIITIEMTPAAIKPVKCRALYVAPGLLFVIWTFSCSEVLVEETFSLPV